MSCPITQKWKWSATVVIARRAVLATVAGVMAITLVGMSIPAEAHHRPGHGGGPPGPPPPTAFADCGTVVQGVECLLFDSDNFGLYVVGQLLFDGSQPGDRIFVEGVLDPFCITYCQQGNGCIADATITDCPEGAELSEQFTVKDVLHLLDAWGPCAFPESCRWDLTGDTIVGPEDLVELLTSVD